MTVQIEPMTAATNSRTAVMAAQADGAWAVHDRAVELAAAGRAIIFLSVGDPDFATPGIVVEAACAALRAGRTHYSPVPGEPALRDAIAARAEVATGRTTARGHVTVYAGAQTALFNVLQTLVDPGDEVLVCGPYYATYPIVALAAGARLVEVPGLPEHGFRLRPNHAAAAITARTRALLINSPGNPSGATLDRAAIAALVALCRERGIWLVADEVYGTLGYDGTFASAWGHAGEDDPVIVVNSLSKSHAMSGWRIGWALAPRTLASRLVTLAEGSQFGCAQFIQDAAVVAITQPIPEVAAMAATYRQRRDRVAAALDAIPGIGCRAPQGGMFVLADVRALDPDCRAFAMALLEAEGVAVTPGSSFGTAARGHIRITLAQPLDVLEEAVRRIARFAAQHAAADHSMAANTASATA